MFIRKVKRDLQVLVPFAQPLYLHFHRSIDSGDRHCMPADKLQVLFIKSKILQHSLFIFSKLPVPIFQKDMGYGRPARKNVEVRNIHASFFQLFPDQRSIRVVPCRPHISALSPKAPNIGSYVHRISSYVTFSCFIIYINTVISQCCDPHFLLHFLSFLSSKYISGLIWNDIRKITHSSQDH